MYFLDGTAYIVYGLADVLLLVIEGNRRLLLLTGIVEVHPADLKTGALFDQMCVQLQLTAVMLTPFFIRLRAAVGFEIHYLHRVSHALDKVDLSLEDIFVLNKAYVHLRLPYRIPAVPLCLGVLQDLFQRRPYLRLSEVEILPVGQRVVIVIQPAFDLLRIYQSSFLSDGGTVDILDSLVYQHTEQIKVRCFSAYSFIKSLSRLFSGLWSSFSASSKA